MCENLVMSLNVIYRKLRHFVTSSHGFALDDKDGETLASQISCGHKQSCGWRDNPCSAALLQMPPIPSHKLTSEFKDRFRKLLPRVSGAMLSGGGILVRSTEAEGKVKVRDMQ